MQKACIMALKPSPVILDEPGAVFTVAEIQAQNVVCLSAAIKGLYWVGFELGTLARVGVLVEVTASVVGW